MRISFLMAFFYVMTDLSAPQNATRLISRKTPGHRQRYSSPKSTPFPLLLPQCTERAQRAHVARASAVFRFLPSPLHLLGIKNCGTTG